MQGVSVVIPCYNAAKFIRETLDSVLSQQYDGPLEVLVADDGSDDGSPEIIASYGPPVRLILKRPQDGSSASCARNRGLHAATQPFVAFLDADDLWMPGHLAALARELEARPELGLVYDKGYYTSSDGCSDFPILDEPHRPRVTPDDLILENCICTGNVMVRREVFSRVGVFDEALRHAEDHDMWLRVLEVFPAAHVPSYGFKYRMHASQKSLRPALWYNAAIVFAKARQRYPYRWSSLRKRSAVLAYRLSPIAFQERRFVRGAALLLKAGLLDPLRGTQELGRYVRRKLAPAR